MNDLKRKVHFVGVGGIGMSGLAEILLNLGYEVSGSDLKATEITERLVEYGLHFREGHDAANLGDAGIMVVSAAVPQDNPEVAAARERRVPILHRSQLLAHLMRLKPNAVVVGGTHGKTTTTSMISAIMDVANIGATSIVGGILHRSGTNARWGAGEYLVAEADEHDGSFLNLHPTIAVVTNVDAEHLEYYGTIDRIKRAFIDFCNRVPFYGYSVLCCDDPNTQSLVEDIESVCLCYGIGEGAAVRGADVRLVTPDPDKPPLEQLGRLRTRFEVICDDARLPVQGRIGTIEINALGLNNVRNALAACAVGLCLGMRFGVIAEGLRHFDGVRRRLQVRGAVAGVVVVEDYAHHPTEIRSTLEAVRWASPGRIVCVFQPHLYTRTKFFCEEFGAALGGADRAILTAIYPSREEPMPGVDSSLIVDAAREQGFTGVELMEDMDEVPPRIVGSLEAGDLVLIMGAGSINRIVEPLLEALRARSW